MRGETLSHDITALILLSMEHAGSARRGYRSQPHMRKRHSHDAPLQGDAVARRNLLR